MRLIPLCLALAPLAATAQPRLDLPVDCVPGDTCFIQNYVDRDPGPGARDYTCQGLSYDGHKGTDFGLPSLMAMQAGVTVRAAAPGRVTGVRNNMIDRLYTAAEDARIKGRDCGNGVVIDHGDGWETQYCHLRQHSVRVRVGDELRAGDPLGLIGLSGRTQFPHLHISVRHNGRPVDPFTPGADADSCGASDTALWADDLLYQPGGILSAGFATQVPSYDAIKAGTASLPHLPRDTDAIVLWAFAFGGRAGDRMDLTITGPDSIVFTGSQTVDKDQAQFFRAGGKRLRAPLVPGTYTGKIRLIRDNQPVSERMVTIKVR